MQGDRGKFLCVSKPAEVYFTMVLYPTGEWIRVGFAYLKRDIAQSWTYFIRKAWRGCRVTVRKCPLKYDTNGDLAAESVARLDREFNIEAGPTLKGEL